MMSNQSDSEKISIQLYYVYAYADGIFSHELDKHLASLQRQGVITEWHSHEISPSTDGKYVFDKFLTTAHIILLLISPDFLMLDFCYGNAIQQAIERHDAHEAIVIPIILRSADWADAPFGDFSALPNYGEPITTWTDQDAAYFNITEGIRDAITQLLSSQSPRKREKLLDEQTTTLLSEQDNIQPITLFSIYSYEDQKFHKQLEIHLSILKRHGVINSWASKIIETEIGLIKKDEIDPSLSSAQIILLLISPDFLNSDYSYSPEMKRILEKHQAGEMRVIPVILRYTNWRDTLFGSLPALPLDGKPVTSWSDTDSAFLNIVEGIRNAIAIPSSLSSSIGEEQFIDTVETLQLIPVASGPIKIFFSYAREDEALLGRLRIHLAALRRQTNIVDFYDRMVSPGAEREASINKELNSAHIILFLVSPDYLASDYIDSVEMPRALERAKAGEVVVMPIILRPVDWHDSPIAVFQALPTGGRPVTSWEQTDEAFYDVAQSIRKVVLSLATRLQQETKEQFILEGKTYYDAHDYEAALASYERALRLDPKDEFVSSIVGSILLHLGRYENALSAYEDLLRISTSASAYLFKGIALQQLDRLTDALEAYQKARELGFSG